MIDTILSLNIDNVCDMSKNCERELKINRQTYSKHEQKSFVPENTPTAKIFIK